MLGIPCLACSLSLSLIMTTTQLAGYYDLGVKLPEITQRMTVRTQRQICGVTNFLPLGHTASLEKDSLGSLAGFPRALPVEGGTI